MKNTLSFFLNTVDQYRSYILAVLLVIGIALWGRGYSPAEAQDAPPAPALAALADIQRLAPLHDEWKSKEAEWERAKQTITEVYGCTISADRSAIDCPLE